VSELTLFQVELSAEFDSESNGDSFRLGCLSKNGTSTGSTDFSDFFTKYSVSGFAIPSELSLKAVELDVELSSASNDTIFDYDHRAKPFHPQNSIRPSMNLCLHRHRNFFHGNPSQK
jgi:hypothetical protein